MVLNASGADGVRNVGLRYDADQPPLVFDEQASNVGILLHQVYDSHIGSLVSNRTPIRFRVSEPVGPRRWRPT